MRLIYLLPALLSLAAHAQQAPLSKQAASVQEKVSHLSAQTHISVIPIAGEEEFGAFLSSDQESFTFHDVDRKLDVTFRYDAVKKVKTGYGGYNTIAHRHVDRTKSRIIVAAIVAGLAALIIAAAVAA